MEDNLSLSDAGSVYSFVRTGTTWEEGGKLIASDPGSNDRFGSSVDLDGDTAVVGSSPNSENRAYVFRRIGADWREEARLGFPWVGGEIGFGKSVAIDGDIAVIGAPELPNGGIAYIYARSGNAWSKQAELTANDFPSDPFVAKFGTSVDVSGQRCIVGSAAGNSATNEFRGAAHVYVRVGETWTEEAKLTIQQGPGANYIGNSVALSGDTALLAAFTRPVDEFGNVNTLEVQGGSAHVFVRSGAAWNQQANLVAGDGAPIGVMPADFNVMSREPAPRMVALDGDTAMVGAPTDNSSSGSARVFKRNGVLWSEQLKLTAGVETTVFDSFGVSTALDGGIAVVGTYRNMIASASTGKAYTFLLGESPVITGQPVSRTVPLTDPRTPVSFTATATGYSPLRYQWRKNGYNIEGAAGELINGTTSYSIPEVTEQDAGLYDVLVSNAGGIATSSPATLSVNVLSELVQSLPAAPPESVGFVFVTLSPAGIGGWRFEGEQNWRQSGVPAGGLATGDRTIEFRPAAGYLQPPSETVGVVSGGAASVIERTYYQTPGTGSGGISVTLKPDTIADSSLPVAERAQWRLLGENESQWRNSGATVAGLAAGNYLVECKPVAGRTTPTAGNVLVVNAQTTSATITYFLTDPVTGTLPSQLSFETVTSDEPNPYTYVGQIRSNVGSSSGFVVKSRVVATAGHVVFDDGTLSAVGGIQWLFQRHSGTYEPKPLVPRGYYIFDGYAAQRELEGTPGSSTPVSQNLDAASIYFLADAGRGGFGGFLASDATDNEFILSPALKTLVGYPVDGISTSNQGRMHATPPSNISFTRSIGKTYTSTDIRSSGGMSGGPLCIGLEDGTYFPAAIYLGGSGQTVVRAIDSQVIDLFNRAEVSGDGGNNNTGGGITHSSFSALGSPTQPGAIEVTIQPAAARDAGAGWRLKPETSYRSGGSRKSGLTPGTYSLQLSTVAGFLAPVTQTVTVNGGQLLKVTFTYAAAPVIHVEIPAGTPIADGGTKSFGTVAAGSSSDLSFTIRNSGNATLSGLSVSIDGVHENDFKVTKAPGAGVVRNATTGFTVRFTPGGPGVRTAAVHVKSNDPLTPSFVINLTGNTESSKQPEIAIEQPAGSPLKDGTSSTFFGSIPVKSSITRTFTIRNTGSAALKGLNITIDGKRAGNFKISPPVKSTLAPKAKTTFKVTFSPTSKGKFSAAIHIASNDADESPFDIKLTGKGVAVTSASPSLSGVAQLPSWTDLYDKGLLKGYQLQQPRITPSVVTLPGGRKYRALTVETNPVGDDPTVEVSSNLVDWYSGNKHTTVLLRDMFRLKVRDNTPFTESEKRFIRVSPP